MKSYYIYNQQRRTARHALRAGIFIAIILAASVTVAGLEHFSRSTARIYSQPEVRGAQVVTQSVPAPITWQAPALNSINVQGLLDATNQQRIKANIAPLTLANKLSSSAQAKCSDMVTNNYWSHIDLAGQEPWHFIDATGYKKQAAGENLAYGFDTSDKVVEGWMNSKAHREKLLDPIYTDVGYGICTSTNFVQAGPQTIVVQHFGRPLP